MSRSRSRSRSRDRSRSRSGGRGGDGDAPRRSTNSEDLFSIRVGNDLPRDYTEDELKAKFKEFGEIGDIYLPRDRGSRDTRGFGFVRFFERKDQEYCVDECKKEPMMIDNIECKVEIASRRPPKYEDEQRQRGGGGRGGYDRGGRGGGYDRRSRSRSRDRGGRRRSPSYDRGSRRRERSRSYDRRRY